MPLKNAPTAFWDTLLPSLVPSQALLATMAIARSDAKIRALFLKRACSSALLMPPGQAVVLLRPFPQDLILAGFGPALLSGPPLGTLAAYILARLGITISPCDLPAVLAATPAISGALENIARLIAPDHKDSAIEALQTGFDLTSPENRQRYDSFIAVLQGARRSEPAEPAWSQVAATGPVAPAAQAPVMPPEKAASPLIQAQARLAGTQPAPVSSDSTEAGGVSEVLLRRLPGIDRNLLLGLIAVFISVPLVFYFSSGSSSESSPLTPMQKTPDKAPKFWTDAVSRRQITQEFLAADNDFQMGEMFVVRQQYGEALSLFRDALSRDPKHVGAQFRVGYCLFMNGDNQGATTAFMKVLQQEADHPQVNLYLARISVAAEDWNKAIEYYQKEFDLSGDVMIALEYVAVLRKLGRYPEAIALLSNIQPRYSGHLEVVNTLAQLRDEAKEQAP